MGKADKHNGISICGFSVSICELAERYEAHFVYKEPKTTMARLNPRIKKSINYLGQEGFFKPHKKIRVKTTHLEKD